MLNRLAIVAHVTRAADLLDSEGPLSDPAWVAMSLRNLAADIEARR